MNQTINLKDSETVQKDKYLLAGLKYIGKKGNLLDITVDLKNKLKYDFETDLRDNYDSISFFIEETQRKIVFRFEKLFGRQIDSKKGLDFFFMDKNLNISIDAVKEYKEFILKNYPFEEKSFEEKERENLKKYFILNLLSNNLKGDRRSLYYSVPDHFLKGKKGEYKRNAETRKLLQQKENVDKITEEDKFQIISEYLTKIYLGRRKFCRVCPEKANYFDEAIEILEKNLKELIINAGEK